VEDAMPTVDVLNTAGQKVGEIELSDDIFGGPVKEYLFHDAVRWQQAKVRAGTHATKTRGEVQGSTRKLFRQKGTGRARRGSVRAPGLKGGGNAFGPKPRDYSYTLPKKVRKAALKSALARRLEEKHLIVLDSFEMTDVKTATAAAVCKTLGLTNAVIVDQKNNELNLSTRNIKNIKFLPVEGLNVRDILKHDSLVLTKRAIDSVEGRLKP
jgi:large subunit ribosomal protein L4